MGTDESVCVCVCVCVSPVSYEVVGGPGQGRPSSRRFTPVSKHDKLGRARLHEILHEQPLAQPDSDRVIVGSVRLRMRVRFVQRHPERQVPVPTPWWVKRSKIGLVTQIWDWYDSNVNIQGSKSYCSFASCFSFAGLSTKCFTSSFLQLSAFVAMAMYTTRWKSGRNKISSASSVFLVQNLGRDKC